MFFQSKAEVLRQAQNDEAQELINQLKEQQKVQNELIEKQKEIIEQLDKHKESHDVDKRQAIKQQPSPADDQQQVLPHGEQVPLQQVLVPAQGQQEGQVLQQVPAQVQQQVPAQGQQQVPAQGQQQVPAQVQQQVPAQVQQQVPAQGQQFAQAQGQFPAQSQEQIAQVQQPYVPAQVPVQAADQMHVPVQQQQVIGQAQQVPVQLGIVQNQQVPVNAQHAVPAQVLPQGQQQVPVNVPAETGGQAKVVNKRDAAPDAGAARNLQAVAQQPVDSKFVYNDAEQILQEIEAQMAVNNKQVGAAQQAINPAPAAESSQVRKDGAQEQYVINNPAANTMLAGNYDESYVTKLLESLAKNNPNIDSKTDEASLALKNLINSLNSINDVDQWNTHLKNSVQLILSDPKLAAALQNIANNVDVAVDNKHEKNAMPNKIHLADLVNGKSGISDTQKHHDTPAQNVLKQNHVQESPVLRHQAAHEIGAIGVK